MVAAKKPAAKKAPAKKPAVKKAAPIRRNNLFGLINCFLFFVDLLLQRDRVVLLP